MNPRADSKPAAAIDLRGSVPVVAPVLLNPLEIPDWDSRVLTHPQATVFHSRGWLQLLHSTYQHRPFYLGIESGKALRSVLPMAEADSLLTGRKAVSLPFTDTCCFLGDGDAAAGVVQKTLELGIERGWKYVEFRGLGCNPFNADPSVSFYGHKLDLTPSVEALFKGFDSSMRRSIRKGEASDLVIEDGATDSLVEDYYRLHCRTRRKHGVPPQPFRFFENLQRYVLAPGNGRIVLARTKSGVAAAGVVFLEFGANAVYKFGASDERLSELRAAHFVMWEAIQRTRAKGSRSLDFGRTSCTNTGLRRFKTGFGCVEESIQYFRLNLPRKTVDIVVDRSTGPLNAVFKRVPEFAARWIGSLLYRHMT